METLNNAGIAGVMAATARFVTPASLRSVCAYRTLGL
jgi:hypothetical protein